MTIHLKNRVIFRADASELIGTGHLSRCLTLASIVKGKFHTHFLYNSSLDPIFKEQIAAVVDTVSELPTSSNYLEDAQQVANKLNQNDIVVLDGYHYDTAYQEKLIQKKIKLVCIDDIHAHHFVSSVVVNHAEEVSIESYSLSPSTTLLLGLKYALINPIFFSKKVMPKSKGEVFINMGGSDSFNNTLKVLRAIDNNTYFKVVHVVTGKLFSHIESLDAFEKASGLNIKRHTNLNAEEIAELLCRSELAICPASTMSLEACAVGLGLLIGMTAENQKDIYNGLVKKGCAQPLGDLNSQTSNDLEKQINSYLTQQNFIEENVRNQRLLIDGHSPDRFIALFNELATC